MSAVSARYFNNALDAAFYDILQAPLTIPKTNSLNESSLQ